MVEVEISARWCATSASSGGSAGREEALGREAKAWAAAERDRLGASVDRRSTTEDARTKLRSLYPATEE